MRFKKFFEAKAFLMTAALALFACGFTACSSDDDGDGDGGGDGSGNDDGNNTENVVVNDIPAFGWRGSFDNGVCTYTPEEHADEEEGMADCYAFKFNNGICETATYNVIFGSPEEAAYAANLLNSGEWADIDEEEDYEEDYYARTRGINGKIANFDLSKIIAKMASANTRSSNNGLSFNVYRNGKVIYISADNFEGKSASDIKYVIDAWSYNIDTPDRIIFGNWNPSTGVYTCNNLYNLGVNYRVEVGFNESRYVTSYITKISLPTAEWAMFMENLLYEESYEFEMMFGCAPNITRNGKNITVEAVILDDEVTEETIYGYLVFIDIFNNTPMLANMFF